MRKLNAVVLLGLGVLLLPAVASAGEPTGACLVFGPTFMSDPDGKGVAICVNDLTETVCDQISKGSADWFADQTCGELDTPWEWEGSCDTNIQPLGDACLVIWADGDGELLCLQNDGTWYEDNLDCGLPVPVMPGFGLAALALLMLAGALIFLTLRGAVPSA